MNVFCHNRMSFRKNFIKSFNKFLSSTRGFYPVQDPISTITNDSDVENFIRPKILDLATDLRKVRPGECIDVPYELTISNSFRDLWHAAFYSHDRINTSTPFSRALGFQDQLIPFSLMLFLSGSMSHADHAKVQTGYKNAIYHWPVFAGDTLTKKFLIRKLRATSDNLNSIFTIDCSLKNQRNVTVFSCEKTMLFPFKVHPSDIVVPRAEETKNRDFFNHLVHQSESLESLGSTTLSELLPGQLILHTLTRKMTMTQTMQLASLARLTHERHFNSMLFRREEMFVPGGLVLGLTCSVASRDLHEVLYEEVDDCSFPNNLSPNDTVGSISFIKSREENVSGDIEAIGVRTIGIKNMDVSRTLFNKNLPLKVS